MPLSGPINSFVVNGLEVNGEFDDEIIAVGAGNLLSFAQIVGANGVGNLLTFKQSVTDFSIGEGMLVELRQQVNAIASGKLVTITQTVLPPNIPISPYIVRNGFYPVFIIGSYVWPETQIHSSFYITHPEGNDKQLTFTLLFRKYVPYGPIDFESFDGAPVAVDIYSLSGNVDRIFTGYINKVDLNIINGTVTCSCVADRKNLILNTYSSVIPLIGYYDEDVLGQSADNFEALEKRLTTVPQTVDVTRFGNLQLSDILPSNTPDYTFVDNQVAGDNTQRPAPTVQKLLRSRVINTVNMAVNYNYQRRYHGVASYSWDWQTDICEFLLEGESLAQKSTIETAINGTGWVLNKNTLFYTPPPANGLYRCAGLEVPIAFTTVKLTNVKYEDVTDPDGNTVTGTDGQPLKKATGGVYEDSRNLLATGADWKTTYRWTQNVTETYTMQLTAPQSILRYGAIPLSDQTTVEDSTDNSSWENYKEYSAPPEEMSHEEDSNIYYWDYTPNRNKLYNALNITLNKAKTTIIKAHRDNRVTFCIDLNPTIEMYHTVYLNCDAIQAHGKVIQIDHFCDIPNGNAYTTITIALTRSIGSATDSVLAFPSIPTQVPPDPQWFITLNSIYGETPPTNFKGFVGNKWKTEDDFTFGFRGTNTYKTNIQEQFIVKSPEIGEDYRKLLKLSSVGNYTMAIPNNIFEVSFL